jgi:hypothetical protein
MKKETITNPAFENGYFMGSNGQTAWNNTSLEYKEGYKEGEALRRVKARIQADKIINEMVDGE